MRDYMYIKRFQWATAVSFTVADTVYKKKKSFNRRLDLVISDATHHFSYELTRIANEEGFSFTDSPFAYFEVKGRTLITNQGADARIFLNVGPGKINLPIELDVGDACLVTNLENTFMSHPEAVVFYRNLVAND